ncbi:MAG: Uma2 family endonuclease [Chloroflexi bacterium]|nr:Uma2 family endonuclease [Chloroflexota bacterium]
MVLQTRTMTAEEFDQWVLLPENATRSFEFIGGEIVEMVSNNYSSMVAALILGELQGFTKGKNLGYLTGADGGYWVNGERYIPDAAFISKTRQPVPSRDAYNPNAPDLAVEVLSPSDDPHTTRLKVVNYLLAGTTLWLVDPERKIVEGYVPGAAPKTLGLDDTLDGGAHLPGFSLAVKDIFPE